MINMYAYVIFYKDFKEFLKYLKRNRNSKTDLLIEKQNKL